MKKILIVSDSTRVGGIQRSLINMLNFIDYSKYSISLLLFDDKNVEEINDKVKIISSNDILRIVGNTSNELKKQSKFKYIKRKILSVLCLIFGSDLVFSFIFRNFSIKDEYDIAISYSNNVNSHSLYYGYNKLILEKVKAKEKKCWIHIDYKSRQRDKTEIKEFSKMDEIILVSEACKENFEMVYPEFKQKTAVVYNVVDKNSIIKMSNNVIDESINNKCFNIVSIGRLERNKNIDAQLSIASKLKQQGLKFKWYVIGNGIDYVQIKNKILELNIDDCFMLLGEKRNVYPYIKKCSLLVSTSLSESFGLTIVEALMLEVPVVALNYPSLKEIVSNDYIYNNLDEICDKIALLIKNKSLYDIYKKNCVYIIDNTLIKKQINNVLGG